MVLLSWGRYYELIIFGAVVVISIIYGKDSEGFVSLFSIVEEAVRVFNDESMDCNGCTAHFDAD